MSRGFPRRGPSLFAQVMSYHVNRVGKHEALKARGKNRSVYGAQIVLTVSPRKSLPDALDLVHQKR